MGVGGGCIDFWHLFLGGSTILWWNVTEGGGGSENVQICVTSFMNGPNKKEELVKGKEVTEGKKKKWKTRKVKEKGSYMKKRIKPDHLSPAFLEFNTVESVRLPFNAGWTSASTPSKLNARSFSLNDSFDHTILLYLITITNKTKHWQVHFW